MIDVAIDKNFASPCWRKRTSGAGSVTVSGSVLTCTGGAGEAAMLDYYLPVLPGQRVEVEVYGRLLSGSAGVYFDLVTHDATGVISSPERVTFTAVDWRVYRLSYTVPLKAGLGSILRIVLGNTTAPAGSAQFLAPTIRTDGGLATPLVLARGLLQVENGLAGIHPSFPSHGIASAVRTALDTVTVTLEHALPNAPEIVRALVHVTGTPDSPHIPVAGTMTSGAAPTFLVKWSNGAAMQDVSGAGFRYVFFQVTA